MNNLKYAGTNINKLINGSNNNKNTNSEVVKLSRLDYLPFLYVFWKASLFKHSQVEIDAALGKECKALTPACMGPWATRLQQA